jgi:hypothetical protein
MTLEPETAEQLCYLDTRGHEVRDSAVEISTGDEADEYLRARTLRLSGGALVRQLYVDRTKGKEGYQRLDNEILAGLRLADQAGHRHHPRECGRLIGYWDNDPVEPFALLEPYRQDSIERADIIGLLSAEQLIQFQVSLLTGLKRLAEAGLVHCAIGPATVRWDRDHVVITGFSLAAPAGTMQRSQNAYVWAQVDELTGVMHEGDDILAAGLLIYYVATGEELTGRAGLDRRPDLKNTLEGVFLNDPADRPSATELLDRLGIHDPVASRRDGNRSLRAGAEEFEERRSAKHMVGQSQVVHVGLNGQSGPAGSGTGDAGDALGGGSAVGAPKKRRWFGSQVR